MSSLSQSLKNLSTAILSKIPSTKITVEVFSVISSYPNNNSENVVPILLLYLNLSLGTCLAPYLPQNLLSHHYHK